MIRKLKVNLIFPLCLLLSIFIVIFPFSAFFLDLFLIFNITFSVLLFLIASLSGNVLSVSFFPAFLLYITLFRLGLNVASTRLILSSGKAGEVISSLGAFISNHSLVSGVTSCIVIFFINYLLVAKGSERIAEVRARFALELLPGKQISLDAESVSGKITYSEFLKRKETIVKEAEFYSSMEGAFKFIKGDIFVSVLIFFINLAGIYVLSIQGYDFSLLLTLILGDSLVSQLPGLLISTGASTLISCVNEKESSFAQTLLIQLKSFSDLFTLGALLPLVLSFIPNVPLFPMFLVSFFMWLSGLILNRNKEDSVNFDSFAFIIISRHRECSVSKGEIKKSVVSAILKLSRHLGVKFPDVKEVEDNSKTKNCSIFLFGRELRLFEEKLENYEEIIMNFLKESIDETINGTFFDDTVVKMRRDCGVFLDELVPKKISRDTFSAVLKCLVKEGISLNFLPKIVSILSVENPKNFGTPVTISEIVRLGLGPLVGKSVLQETRSVFSITFEEKLEQMLLIPRTLMNISLIEKIFEEIKKITDSLHVSEHKKKVIILTSESARPVIKKLIERQFSEISVFSYAELSFDIEIYNVGIIEDSVLAL